MWIAEYDLASTKEDELSLKTGNMLRIMEKSDSGWWKGRCDNGDTGWLPASYLRVPTAQELQEKKEVVCVQNCIIVLYHCVEKHRLTS